MSHLGEKIVQLLLDPDVSVAEKFTAFSRYLQSWQAVSRNMHLGVRHGRQAALSQLKDSVSRDEAACSKLARAIEEVQRYGEKCENDRASRVEGGIRQLRTLASGTAIVIQNEDREDHVAFLEVKRTRFTCEYPDGRRYSFPADAFLRTSERSVARLTQAEADNRAMIRELAGRAARVVEEALVARGLAVIRELASEYAAAHDRIENAPRGMSKGAISAYLGPCRLVNPRDQTLVKRIPEVLRKLAAQHGMSMVRDAVSEQMSGKLLDRLLDRLA